MNQILMTLGKIIFLTRAKLDELVSMYLQRRYHRLIRSVGKEVKFNGISNISGGENIVLGDNVHIGNNAWIHGGGGLQIGDNTHIARNLVIYTQNHEYEGKYLPYDSNMVSKKVIIEKNVWIGINVTILPGTHIGEGAIIGAGSVVRGTVENLSIYGASLGQVIGTRNQDLYEKRESEKQYGGSDGNKYPDTSE